MECAGLTYDGYDHGIERFPCRGFTYIDRVRDYCVDTVDGGSGCFDEDGDVMPRPSLEARQVGGHPRCGLEPDGFIVCGAENPWDVDDPDYVKLINLP